MNVLLLQLDGKLPNIALMRIAAHHREQGDIVELRQVRNIQGVERGLWDDHDKIYASCIFARTQSIAKRLREVRQDAILGGTGWNLCARIEDYGVTTLRQDYSDYPAFSQSIGFTQRGCRLSCWFCVVPKKEGKVVSVASIYDIWRGEPWPREILLLDNDFFGQDCWRERIAEIRTGGFKVSFNQGINARMLSEEAAAAIASVDYRDDGMKVKRIYTAWDSLEDEKPLFRGLNALLRHGVRPDHIMVYMLIEGETIQAQDIERERRLREFGCRPYPMPLVRNDETRGFQRWVVRRANFKCTWEAFKQAHCRPEKIRKVTLPLFGMKGGV